MAASKSFKPFVVSFGGEDFFLDRDLDKARHWAGRKAILLDGDGMHDYEVVGICETNSEEPRTIIVDNAQELKGTKDLLAYIENRPLNDTSVILVGILRTEKLPEVWSLALSKGKGYERKPFKPWDVDGYVKWMRKEAEHSRVSIDAETAKNLLQLVGQDLYRLANEIKKLALYIGGAERIKKEHILLVTTPSPKAEPFQVAEMVLGKEVRKALNAFSTLYKNSGDKCLIPVVYAVMKQVEKTAIIRSLQDKGVPEADIAVLVGMKEWPLKNVAAPIARKHELRTLVQHMGRLCKLDADVKGPALSKRTLVELTMLSIAQ
jgi:DNA polymerase III delta subunit